jgi:hypothetical protein
MDRYFIILIGAIGLVYGDLDSPSRWVNVALPGLFIASLAWLFWLKGFLIIVAAATIFQYIDLGSASLFKSVLLPLLFGLCIIYFCWWGVFSFEGGIDIGDLGGDGGSDCGGCDGG